LNTFNITYVTTLPKEGNAPRINISGNHQETYDVCLYDKNTLVKSLPCQTNQTIIPKVKQWFTNWVIKIFDSNNNLVFIDEFNPNNKTIFIKIDAFALGDNIAWIPYVEEFRKKHNCVVICSTFFNELFIKSYPNILFVKPNTTIHNVYAQYYIGASNENNIFYSPIKSNFNPLQKVASEILGLPFTEIKPNLLPIIANFKSKFDKKYVTISEFASSPNKHWLFPNAWQILVDFLINNDYLVVSLSKEQSNLNNVIKLNGDLPLIDRAIDIHHAHFHIGLSSGLSWLAWSLNTHVFLIGDTTPIWHEFQSNTTRFYNNLETVIYLPEHHTHIDNVIEKVAHFIHN
jgi:autotransporter strand-loop-strand O-heptosyltransferase